MAEPGVNLVLEWLLPLKKKSEKKVSTVHQCRAVPVRIDVSTIIDDRTIREDDSGCQNKHVNAFN